MNARIGSLWLVALAALAACTPDVHYRGDGTLVDQGFTARDHRYVVELGPLDLAHTGSHVFHFSGLPKEHYVVGLQVPLAAARGSDPDSGTTANVALQLMRGGRGQVLIITGPLRELDWATEGRSDSSFVYRHRNYESYFDAEPGEQYELRVDVNVPDAAIAPGTKVELKSGGWK